jgi:hypothetical protein
MSNTQTITNNGELQRESPVLTPSNEEVTAFGFGKEELLNRLRDEEEFSATFMTEYAVLQDIVKEFKKEKKEKEAAKRLAAKKEKEEGERVHLNSIISKIQEKDAEFAEVPDDLMTKEVTLIKAWIKEYRSRVKEAKAAAKAEKAAAKDAKLAEKEAKAAAKAEKETAMREKLLIKIEKMLEKTELFDTDISDYQEKSLGELKIAHSHMKMIIHLAEWDDYIPNISHWTTETKFEELKEIHTRAQLLKRVYTCKIDPEDDAMQPMYEKMNEFKKEGYKHKASVEEIKEFIKQVKGQ